MKKKIFLFALITVLTMAFTAQSAIVKYSGTASNGATAKGAAVSVFISGTGTPATIYSDAAGNIQLGSPASASATGTYEFYIEEGTYNIFLDKAGMTTQANMATVIAAPSLSGTNAWSGDNTFTGATTFTTALAASSGGTGTTADLFSGALTGSCEGTSVSLTIVNGLITAATCTP